MSWDVDEVEFYETFAEIAADPARGLEDAKRWAWSALRWTQQENRKLRAVLAWVEAQCPGKCSGVCDDALRVQPARAEGIGVRLATADELVEMGLLEFDEKEDK